MDYIIIGIIAGICVLFFIREIATWYWKINERVSMMEKQLKVTLEIRDLLKKMDKERAEERKARENIDFTWETGNEKNS